MLVTNIPTAADFHDDALSTVNLAFDTFHRFLVDHLEVINWAGDETPDTFLHLSKSNYLFKNIINLSFGAIELELKSKLCESSPFLLVDGPRGWPKAGSKKISFGEFRAISASDLPRAIKLFSAVNYRPEAWVFFERLRKMRNETTHSSTSNAFNLHEIFKIITDTFDMFFFSRNPFPLRTSYLSESDQSFVAADYLRNWVVEEFRVLREAFGQPYFAKNFGIPDKRLIPCGHCAWEGTDWDDQPGTASFVDDSVTCFVCGKGDDFYESYCGLCEGEQLFSKASDICFNCGHKK